MVLFIAGTVWVYAQAANLQEQEQQIRYWPALVAAPENPAAPNEAERPLKPGVASVAE